jgi:UDP-3-O-[3-hydroxymyristoyl] glucosamine N-acyltransferase
MTKYKLTNETIEYKSRILHRIKALRDFGDVKKGDLGGFIESEKNLSHYGECWVYDNAKACDNAKVYENAKICDNAEVLMDSQTYGNARVGGDALVYGNARVGGNAKVYDEADVSDNARVFGNAEVCGKAFVHDDAEVYGNLLLHSGFSSGSRPVLYLMVNSLEFCLVGNKLTDRYVFTDRNALQLLLF